MQPQKWSNYVLCICAVGGAMFVAPTNHIMASSLSTNKVQNQSVLNQPHREHILVMTSTDGKINQQQIMDVHYHTQGLSQFGLDRLEFPELAGYENYGETLQIYRNQYEKDNVPKIIYHLQYYRPGERSQRQICDSWVDLVNPEGKILERHIYTIPKGEHLTATFSAPDQMQLKNPTDAAIDLTGSFKFHTQITVVPAKDEVPATSAPDHGKGHSGDDVKTSQDHKEVPQKTGKEEGTQTESSSTESVDAATDTNDLKVPMQDETTNTESPSTMDTATNTPQLVTKDEATNTDHSVMVDASSATDDQTDLVDSSTETTDLTHTTDTATSTDDLLVKAPMCDAATSSDDLVQHESMTDYDTQTDPHQPEHSEASTGTDDLIPSTDSADASTDTNDLNHQPTTREDATSTDDLTAATSKVDQATSTDPVPTVNQSTSTSDLITNQTVATDTDDLSLKPVVKDASTNTETTPCTDSATMTDNPAPTTDVATHTNHIPSIAVVKDSTPEVGETDHNTHAGKLTSAPDQDEIPQHKPSAASLRKLAAENHPLAEDDNSNTDSSADNKQLPQTGSQSAKLMVAIGVAILALCGLFKPRLVSHH